MTGDTEWYDGKADNRVVRGAPKNEEFPTQPRERSRRSRRNSKGTHITRGKQNIAKKKRSTQDYGECFRHGLGTSPRSIRIVTRIVIFRHVVIVRTRVARAFSMASYFHVAIGGLIRHFCVLIEIFHASSNTRARVGRSEWCVVNLPGDGYRPCSWNNCSLRECLMREMCKSAAR